MFCFCRFSGNYRFGNIAILDDFGLVVFGGGGVLPGGNGARLGGGDGKTDGSAPDYFGKDALELGGIERIAAADTEKAKYIVPASVQKLVNFLFVASSARTEAPPNLLVYLVAPLRQVRGKLRFLREGFRYEGKLEALDPVADDDHVVVPDVDEEAYEKEQRHPRKDEQQNPRRLGENHHVPVAHPRNEPDVIARAFFREQNLDVRLLSRGIGIRNGKLGNDEADGQISRRLLFVGAPLLDDEALKRCPAGIRHSENVPSESLPVGDEESVSRYVDEVLLEKESAYVAGVAVERNRSGIGAVGIVERKGKHEPVSGSVLVDGSRPSRMRVRCPNRLVRDFRGHGRGRKVGVFPVRNLAFGRRHQVGRERAVVDVYSGSVDYADTFERARVHHQRGARRFPAPRQIVGGTRGRIAPNRLVRCERLEPFEETFDISVLRFGNSAEPPLYIARYHRLVEPHLDESEQPRERRHGKNGEQQRRNEKADGDFLTCCQSAHDFEIPNTNDARKRNSPDKFTYYFRLLFPAT